MKIKDLPLEIKELALLRQKEQGNKRNENSSLEFSDESFVWFETTECDGFWDEISNGNFSVYYEKYGYPNDKPKETITIPKGTTLSDYDKIHAELNDKLKGKEEYDFINPNHYKKFSYEVIEMMEAIWGKEATAIHCEMCAFKYRLRMGEKPDQPIERDLDKVNWYLNKAKELRK